MNLFLNFIFSKEGEINTPELFQKYPLILNTGARIKSTFRTQHLNITGLLKSQLEVGCAQSLNMRIQLKLFKQCKASDVDGRQLQDKHAASLAGSLKSERTGIYLSVSALRLSEAGILSFHFPVSVF